MTDEQLELEPDSRLLQRFAGGYDERAFAVLVARHGRMLMGVCARMLRNRADAEDAFQATLMALAKRAPGLGRVESVGGWLHNAAVRVCHRIRAHNYRWDRNRKALADSTREDFVEAKRPDNELAGMLDEELARLPARLREVIVLCDLQGLTRARAAKTLSVPTGTVASRLTRGRGLLHARLVRRGVCLSASALTLAVDQLARAAPGVSSTLVAQGVRGAKLFALGNVDAQLGVDAHVANIARGAIHAMMFTKLKTAAPLVVLVLFAVFAAPRAAELIGAGFGRVHAKTIIYDDFEDGSVLDGSPAKWETYANWPDTAFEVVDGSLRVTSAL